MSKVCMQFFFHLWATDVLAATSVNMIVFLFLIFSSSKSNKIYNSSFTSTGDIQIVFVTLKTNS